VAPSEFEANMVAPVSAKNPPAPTPPTPTDAPEAADAPARSQSPFNRHFQAPRRPKKEREPSGRILPPAPAWMMKPLKPPRAPSRD
jgi:hypothetical protein